MKTKIPSISHLLGEADCSGAALVLICGILFSPAICRVKANPIMDQAYIAATTGNTIIAARFNTAQTFTVGLSGTLIKVDVLIGQVNNLYAEPLTLDVRTTTVDGVPTEPDSGLNILTSLTLPATAIPASNGQTFGWVTFDIPDVAVSAGQTLAIAMKTDAGVHLNDPDDVPFVWNADNGIGGSPGTYIGGGAFARGESAGSSTWIPLANTDYSFQTFVDPVPEPSAVGLLAIGTVALIIRRRHQI